jgi:thioredoxin
MAKNIKQEEFQTEVLDVKGKVLVDFWAPWCGPCQMLGPIIDQISTEMEKEVKVVKVNVDESPKISSKYGVSGIPTVILFKEGKIIETIVGFRQKEDYEDIINKA